MISFANGDQLPQLGLGTWRSEPGLVAKAIKVAVAAGYRHIDCAAIYGNEQEIGGALAELFADGVVKREDLWITSKLWNDAHAPDAVQPALEKTLADLGLDYLDLYLMHWPVASLPGGPQVPLEDCPLAVTWEAMVATVGKGLTRHIGVSNFSEKKLRALVAASDHKPEMNQIELHPYLAQQGLVDYCKATGIAVTGYSPLGSPGRPAGLISADDPVLLKEPVLAEIADKHGVSAAQVLLQWALHRGTVVIPKSVTPARIEQNFAAVSVQLTEDDVARIAKLDRHRRYVTGIFWVKKSGPYTLASLWDE
ncbi:MAG: aldo/keto reductase [Myxococcales bacterium]|nr:aldo/keto reductase [Myxococcales bacterium]